MGSVSSINSRTPVAVNWKVTQTATASLRKGETQYYKVRYLNFYQAKPNSCQFKDASLENQNSTSNRIRYEERGGRNWEQSWTVYWWGRGLANEPNKFDRKGLATISRGEGGWVGGWMVGSIHKRTKHNCSASRTGPQNITARFFPSPLDAKVQYWHQSTCRQSNIRLGCPCFALQHSRHAPWSDGKNNVHIPYSKQLCV